MRAYDKSLLQSRKVPAGEIMKKKTPEQHLQAFRCLFSQLAFIFSEFLHIGLGQKCRQEAKQK